MVVVILNLLCGDTKVHPNPKSESNSKNIGKKIPPNFCPVGFSVTFTTKNLTI